MTQKDKTPESFEDVKRHLFKKGWIWLALKPVWIKSLVILSLLLLIFAGARLNFFGTTLYRYSKLLTSFEIPVVDPDKPVIPLSLNYEIEDGLGRHIGKLGGTCFSKNHLYISFKVGISCWITVFGVDSKGIFPIFRNKLDPSYIDKEKDYILDFKLDETEGNEIYYAITALERFSYQKDIEMNLKKVFHSGSSKGAAFSKYQIELPEKFTQKFIYFRHLSE